MKPLVIVGGEYEPYWLPRNSEWIPGDPRKVSSLVGRVLSGSVTEVIVLDALMKHQTFSPVLEATRARGVRLAYGKKGTKRFLEEALNQLRKVLT